MVRRGHVREANQAAAADDPHARPVGDDASLAAAGGGISLRCRGVVHLYRTFEGHDVVALQGVDLDIRAGERVAFLGPSGSGKSTLLTLFGGIQRPSAGKIFLGEQEISRMGERELTKVRAQRVSTMLQGASRNLLPYATSRQNLAFARVSVGHSDRVVLDDTDLLDRVGLADQADQVVRTLSGGQQQRLALACAITSSPQLLLADEPTSQLSHEDRDHMLELIHGLGDELGTTIVVVTHQPEVAETFAAHDHHEGRPGRRRGARRRRVRRDRGRGSAPPPGPPQRPVAAGHVGPDRARGRGHLAAEPARRRHAPAGAHMTGQLVVDQVELVIRGKQILYPISIEFHPGEVTAVSGPSGSGKTSLLSVAGGLLAPSHGLAEYDGRPTWQGDGDPRPEVAFVLQVYGLVPILSARENVAVALRARGVPVAEVEARATDALDRFHIGDLGDRQVEELSGGQMQRVACARAFVVGAEVLLADEPTSELDEGNREHVMAELRAEAARGAVVVVATHDAAVVAASHRHMIIDEGRIVDHVAKVGRHVAGSSWS